MDADAAQILAFICFAGTAIAAAVQNTVLLQLKLHARGSSRVLARRWEAAGRPTLGEDDRTWMRAVDHPTTGHQ